MSNPDRLPWLCCVALAAILVWVLVRSSGAVREAEAAAAVHEEVAGSHKVRADSLARALIPISQRIDSMAEAYAADSLRWAESDAENRVRIARLTDRANAARAALEASLDSAGTALLAEYTQATDSIIEAKDVQIRRLTADRALLWARLQMTDELVVGLHARSEALSGALYALERSNDALRSGLRSADRKANIVTAVGVLLAAKLAYDVVR